VLFRSSSDVFARNSILREVMIFSSTGSTKEILRRSKSHSMQMAARCASIGAAACSIG